MLKEVGGEITDLNNTANKVDENSFQVRDDDCSSTGGDGQRSPCNSEFSSLIIKLKLPPYIDSKTAASLASKQNSNTKEINYASFRANE